MLHTLSLTGVSARMRLAWIAFLIAVSLLFSLAFACAVPLAAFAAIAALTLNRREALAASGGVWLVNQAIGFCVLHYPLEPATFAWGLALGIITLLACAGTNMVLRRLPSAAGLLLSFFVSFFIYEGVLLAIDLAMNLGSEAFTAAILIRIFLINACTFCGLMALRALSFAFSQRDIPVPLAR